MKINKVEVNKSLSRGNRRYIDLLNRYLYEGTPNDEDEIIEIIKGYITFKGYLKVEVYKKLLINRLKLDADIFISLS